MTDAHIGVPNGASQEIMQVRFLLFSFCLGRFDSINSVARPFLFPPIQELPAIPDACVSVPNGASQEIMQVRFLLLSFCLGRKETSVCDLWASCGIGRHRLVVAFVCESSG
jgi:hypothetical protein